MSGRAVARRVALALGGVLLLAAALADVAIIEPTINVRWRDEVTPPARAALEQRYSLEAGEFIEGTTWRYRLRDRSRENIGALVTDAAVDDTAEIDRSELTSPGREIRVTFPRARFLAGEHPAALVQVQSLLLFAAAGALLWAARIDHDRRRRTLAIIVLAMVGVVAYAIPLRQPIRMGDSNTYINSRDGFEFYSGVRQLRYEAHLSHAILGRIDAAYGRTDSSPARALDTLMRLATAWFILCAIAIGVLERWSPAVVRYLALVLLAPASLLYFGYRELGHLSLNAAAFPLFIRGLQSGTRRLEAGSALFGFGAALHGFGLLSIAGAGLAAIGAAAPFTQRLRRGVRVAGWALTAYFVWFAAYFLVLRLPIVAGHAASIPLRPWFVDEIGQRVNAAIFSAEGARDLFFTAWVIGAPLILVAGSTWREHGYRVRAALLYAVPSVVFTIVFWPIQGLGVEMDLVFAAFPALYACAWVCACDWRRTLLAAALLATAHVAFWRIVLSVDWVNSRLY